MNRKRANTEFLGSLGNKLSRMQRRVNNLTGYDFSSDEEPANAAQKDNNQVDSDLESILGSTYGDPDLPDVNSSALESIKGEVAQKETVVQINQAYQDILGDDPSVPKGLDLTLIRCYLLEAPKMNAVIEAKISPAAKKRDGYKKHLQNGVGSAVMAEGSVLSTLIVKETITDEEDPSQSRYPGIDGRKAIGKAFLRRGTPPESLDIILASLSKSTLDQYQVAFKQWQQFCLSEKLNFFDVNNFSLLKFLTKKFKEGAAYGTLNSFRSAISLISSNKVGEDPLISRFLKGAFRLKPSFPKYSFIWDVSTVLNHITQFLPLENLSFSTLTFKTVILISLATAQRAQTLASIKLENTSVRTDKVQISIKELLKTSAPGRDQPLLNIPFFREKPELCVASTLLEYIKVSSKLRGSTNNLFTSLKKTLQPSI